MSKAPGADLQEEAGVRDGLPRGVAHGLMHEQRHRRLDAEARVQWLCGARHLRRDREHAEPPLQLVHPRVGAVCAVGRRSRPFLEAVDQERVLEGDLQSHVQQTSVEH